MSQGEMVETARRCAVTLTEGEVQRAGEKTRPSVPRLYNATPIVTVMGRVRH